MVCTVQNWYPDADAMTITVKDSEGNTVTVRVWRAENQRVHVDAEDADGKCQFLVLGEGD